MYKRCEIYVSSKYKQTAINLKESLKYIHLPSSIFQKIINDKTIEHKKDCVFFLLYSLTDLEKLKIKYKPCIIFIFNDVITNKIIHTNKIKMDTTISFLKENTTSNICNLLIENDNKRRNIHNFKLLSTVAKLLNIKVNFDKIYNYAIQYKHNNIKNLLTLLKENNKEKHRYICFYNIDLISNIEIFEFGKNKSKETVLIEFRIFPHLEFLIRNTIIKLGHQWNHTVVCGETNYNFIKSMCNKICRNVSSKIKIVKLNYNNINRDEYCSILRTTNFWNNFIGEYILLYQEDSILFHGNIQPFLKYDYIGAPWFKKQDDNSNHVGNGGFSLRRKTAMIRVIKENKSIKIGSHTKNYMKTTKLNCVPEDVYFSKCLIDYKLGLVADYDVALNFSQETIKGNNPLGGHSFWLAEPNKKIYKSYELYDTNYYSTVTHRGGWKEIIKTLMKKEIINYNNINNSIILLDNVEKIFLWEQKKIILKEKWIGIIHTVPNAPDYLKNIQLELLLKNVYFNHSLKSCVGLIVLSEYLKNYLLLHLKDINIKVIKHPCIINSNITFDIHSLKQKIVNNSIKIIQLGSQLRFFSTIFKLKSNYSKLWLPGRKDTNLLYTWLNSECITYNIELSNEEKNTVNIYYTNNYLEYDSLLTNNIIVIHLINASANNAILELMSMNIPFFVNRLPAVEEYIGKDYPLYFSDIQEIENIIHNQDLLIELYESAYKYLRSLSKKDITIEHFSSEILKFIN